VVRPAVDIPSRVHSPATFPPPFGRRAAKLVDMFRPHGFSPSRRFTPCDDLGFVAPRSRPGFVVFPGLSPNLAPHLQAGGWTAQASSSHDESCLAPNLCVDGSVSVSSSSISASRDFLAGTLPFPTTRFTPLEEFPSPAAAPRHRGRCPLDVRTPQNSRPQAITRSAPYLRSTRLPTPKHWEMYFPVMSRRLQGFAPPTSP